MLEYLLSGHIMSACLVALVVGLFFYWMIRRLKYNYPPGPKGLPILGNLLQLDQNFHEQVFEWSAKYGPVVTVMFGHMPTVFVNKIDEALEVLVKKSTDFATRVSLPSTDVLTYGGKDIVFGSYGPTWKLHRRISSKALRHYMQGDSLENRISDAVVTVFDEMDKEIGEFDPENYVNFIAVNILTGICFGGKYPYGDQEIVYILKKDDEFMKQLGTGTLEDYIPGLRFVYKTESFRSVEELTDELINKFVKKKYNEAKRSFNRDNIRHFCDNLIFARLEAVEEEGRGVLDSLTEDHLIQTLADIFLAGIDTSRFTLNFAINHMIAFPDIQEKVQEEIDRVVGKDRLPCVADRPNLGYTEAVLHESMRLATVNPTGVMHMTSCDTTVGGYKIPKGTVVAINHWALHHDPEAWEDVNRFIPERYLDENGKLGPKPKNWLPFSAGKRVCLGEFVAKPELHLLFACLMQRYKWKLMSGRCADINPVGNAFLLSSKPYKVMLERRI